MKIKNTGSCQSAITLNGEVLRYRGYSIEELARNQHFVVAFLLIYGITC